MAKYTKADIETLVKEIFRWASANKLGKGFGVFYGDKLKSWEWKGGKYVKETKTVNPLDYCEYFPEEFIGGMCYDGTMYECINDYGYVKAYEKLEKILAKYDLYLEHCDSCHAVFAPNEDVEDYEYTKFVKEKPVWLHDPDDAPDRFIRGVMHMQFLLASKVGDKGACTIGEYIEFRYQGTLYRMVMQTPFQGDQSWMQNLGEVKHLLELMGATDIYVDYGRLD